MIDLKAFRKINSITQVDLADYLGVGQGFISQIEKGSRPLPKENISKLLANPFGWDTSMLTEGKQPQLVNENGPSLTSIEALLRDMLAEERARVEALNEMIWELKAENARLQEQLRIKGGDAIGAEDFLSATA